MLNRTLLAIFGTLVAAPVAAAQDPYEIQVYEYVTVPRGKWNLETHFNHTGKGAMKGQTNLTFELTRGVTDTFELAGYIVTARREGVGALACRPEPGDRPRLTRSRRGRGLGFRAGSQGWATR